MKNALRLLFVLLAFAASALFAQAATESAPATSQGHHKSVKLAKKKHKKHKKK